MTAQGEDILAWTEATISRIEEAAQRATKGTWRTHDTHLDLGGHTATILVGRGNDTELLAWLPTMSYESWDETRNAWNNAEHIALNDPASVLRRCAADRKQLELHGPMEDPEVVGDDLHCTSCRVTAIGEFDAAPWPCATVRALAEGYGWTEGER